MSAACYLVSKILIRTQETDDTVQIENGQVHFRY